MSVVVPRHRILQILGFCLGLLSFAANTSPVSGLKMTCHPVAPLAAVSIPADHQEEEAFCSIDLASASVAICPKTWSTSPGALVYDLTQSEWEGRASEFEQDICSIGGRARDQAHRELAIFKNSLNGRDTSGTFAPSSLLYYHFSRLLQTRLQVPVAVIAEFSLPEYRRRVVLPGLEYSESGGKKMLHAGWLELDAALSNPEKYPYRREMINPKNTALWGVLLLESGHRYGPEVNGTRASGWGDGQNRDFQKTAPFLALRSDLPLYEAIAAGLEQARADATMQKALAKNISPQQVAWWMHELTELVILDTILRQQDRIGNIDYQWRWVWSQNGALHHSQTDPGVAESFKLRVSVLNDNDAGVRSSYANYASRTKMLSDWHHMDPGLYQRVLALAADFEQSGPLAEAVRHNYRLSVKEAEGIIERGINVGAQLKGQCDAGALRFDLAVQSVLNPSTSTEGSVSCEPFP